MRSEHPENSLWQKVAGHSPPADAKGSQGWSDFWVDDDSAIHITNEMGGHRWTAEPGGIWTAWGKVK